MLLGAPSLAYRVPTLSPSRMAARTMCQRSGARALRELSHTRLFMTAAGSSSMISEKPDWDQGRGGDATADARDAHLQTAKLALLSAVAGMDRGAAAGSVERKAVLAAAGVLERESTLAYPEDVSKSDGLWRLVYSSALSAGSGSGGGASARNEQVVRGGLHARVVREHAHTHTSKRIRETGEGCSTQAHMCAHTHTHTHTHTNRGNSSWPSFRRRTRARSRRLGQGRRSVRSTHVFRAENKSWRTSWKSFSALRCRSFRNPARSC